MANLTSSQIKDSYQSVLTTSETTSDPTTGTLQNGKGSAITALGVSGTVTATKLVPTGNVTAGNGMYLPTTNVLALGTNGAERMRIDASGNVGIGTASPATKLDVATSSASFNNGISLTAPFVNGNDNGLRMSLRPSNSTTAYAGIGMAFENLFVSQNAYLAFYTGTFASPMTERMRIDASGQVGIGVAPTSRNNTRLQIVDGIGFPATQVASTDPNTLDDYEEGTFDFGIAFGGSSTGVTYSNRQGKYTKIGNKVTVTGIIILTSKGAQVGDAFITGLPFTIANVLSNYSATSLWFSNITFANQFQGYGLINTTTIALEETTEAGAVTSLTNADFANNSSIILSLTYFVS
jgi:hypothetical protein